MRGKGVGRLAAAGVGVVLLSGFGGAALADDGEVESQEAEIWFEVLSPPEPGALSMSVEVVGSADGPEAELAEGTSDDPAVRVFTGSLPLVTV
ncbi:MAG: hypothetical protein LBG60_00460, partial [Bifidobacteriaceae bacterium]|nr:hypothetical protein [Bifidobacteriaceae bacterium]